MVIELYYSSELFGFPLQLTEDLKKFVNEFYGKIDILDNDIESIIGLMKYDKKNVSGKVNFVLVVSQMLSLLLYQSPR